MPPSSRWTLMHTAHHAQAEADGGDDEAPPDEESDDGSVAGPRVAALPLAGPLPTLLRPARPPAWESKWRGPGG